MAAENWTSIRNSEDLADGVSLYTKVATLLRHKVSSGEWPVGHQLPIIDVLASEFGIAKVTVRQALALLSAEGLVVSQRGRGTFVCGTPKEIGKGLSAAINNPLLDDPNVEIRVIGKRIVAALPPDLGGSLKTAESYVRLNKIHAYKGQVFAYMEVYIAKDVFSLFPKGAEKKRKISRLLTDVYGKRVNFIRQSLSVEPADSEIAGKLNYAIAAPVAKLRRWSLDHTDRVIFAGFFWYRGDRFVLEFDLPFDFYSQNPSTMFPAPPR